MHIREVQNGMLMKDYFKMRLQIIITTATNMANGVTSPKPKSGSLSALRNEGLTAVKIWAVNAARRLLYNAMPLRASV